MGTGKIGGHLFLIASQETGPWAFHGNLGYIRNENDTGEVKDIWHASLAATYEVIKDLKLVADIGVERNIDEKADNDPAFLIGGIIYSVNENFDVDCGVKLGLNDLERMFPRWPELLYGFKNIILKLLIFFEEKGGKMHIPDGYLGPTTSGLFYVVMAPLWATASKYVKKTLRQVKSLCWRLELHSVL